MKKSLFPCLLAIAYLSIQPLKGHAQTPQKASEFHQQFEQARQKGTLLTEQTSEDFRRKGWGLLYRDAVVQEFTGTTVEGVRLEMSPSEGYPLLTRRKVDLKYHLYNDSDKAVSVAVSGSCKVVHAASYILIDPHGRLYQLGSGSHCFCEQYDQPLEPHSSVELDANTTDKRSVDAFVPYIPGKYVIIGSYYLHSTPLATSTAADQILSGPLVIQLRKPTENEDSY